MAFSVLLVVVCNISSTSVAALLQITDSRVNKVPKLRFLENLVTEITLTAIIRTSITFILKGYTE